MIENIKEAPESRIISLLSPIILATIRVIRITATEGEKNFILWVYRGNRALRKIPVTTGIKTTFKVL